MIPIRQALDILQENMPQARMETVDLAAAQGRYLAEAVMAPEPSPRYTNSAMDGYALRWADVSRASAESPVMLRVIGESRAGMPFEEKVGPNMAVHISTGAMLPAGTDTVVRVEDTRTADNGAVEILSVRCRGQDVRCEGEEFDCGDELLCRGMQFGGQRRERCDR